MAHYSPKIDYALIQKLYRLKHSSKKKIPLTQMVNEAVKEYLEKEEQYKSTAT